MKKNGLSLTLAVLVLAAPLAALTCYCVAGDCGAGGKVSASAQEPQCHHSSKAPGARSNSPKECCGKCRVEQAELSSKNFTGGVLHRVIHAAPVSYDAAVLSRLSTGHLSRDLILRGPPGNFFISSILNASLTFRGPPAGSFCFWK